MKIVETDRLYLREFTLEDMEHIYKLHNDMDVMKYISTKSDDEISLKECKGFIRKQLDYYRKNEGLGIWATIIKDTDDFIGWTTLKDLDNTADVELGYRYNKEFWGMGYGTEISGELIKYGFDKLQLSKIVAVALPENKASTRIMEKIGMEYKGVKHYYDADVAYYEIETN